MATINFISPKPLPSIRDYEEYKYPITHKSYLSLPKITVKADLFETANRRMTRREFGPLACCDLEAILWFSSKVKQQHQKQGKTVWQKRPVPSGGGRHPIDVLVIEPTSKAWKLSVYDPNAHCLCYLRVDSLILEDFLCEIDNIVSLQRATILWCAAQPLRTLAKYENGESLVWRDVGVLQGQWSLLAEGLKLSSCLLGITGDEWIAELLPSGGQLVGMGGCLVGSRVDEDR